MSENFVAISTDEILMLNGKPFYIIGGEIHPARIPPELWEDRLLKMKAAGLNTINIYIFWNWEERNGTLDLSEIRRFVELVKKYGFMLILRPGAYTCAEWRGGGYPERLIDKLISLRTLDPEYLRIEKKYHSAVINALRDYFYPKGPIILYQVENEFFWGMTPYLYRLYKMVRKLGVDVPVIVNENAPASWKTPLINGADFYPVPPDMTHEIMTIARVLLWNRRGKHVKPRMAIEMQGGWFLQYGSSDRSTTYGEIPAWWTDAVMKTAVGFGLDGWSMYMFTGGTNWPWWAAGGTSRMATSYDYTAPIGELGQPNPRYYVVRVFALFLKTFMKEILATKPTASPLVQLMLTILKRKGSFFVYKRKADKKRSRKCGVKWNKHMKFVFAVNITKKQKTATVKSLAGKVKIPVSPYSSKAIPVNVEIAPGLYLAYATSQIIEIVFLSEKEIIISCHDSVNRGEIAFLWNGNVIKSEYTHDSITRWLNIGDYRIGIFPFASEYLKWYWDINGVPALIVNATMKTEKWIEAINDMEFILSSETNITINNQKLKVFQDNSRLIANYPISVHPPAISIEPVGYAPVVAKKWERWKWNHQKPGYAFYRLPPGKLLVGFKDVMRIFRDKKDVVISALKMPPRKPEEWFDFLNMLEGAVVEIDNNKETTVLLENTGSRNLIPLAKGGLLFAIRFRKRIPLKKWKFRWGFFPFPAIKKLALFLAASSMVLPIKKLTWWTSFNAPEDGWILFHGISEDAKIQINEKIFRATNARSPFILPVRKGKNKIIVHTANIHGQGVLGPVEYVSGDPVIVEKGELVYPFNSAPNWSVKKPRTRVFWKRYKLNVGFKEDVFSPPVLIIRPKNANKHTRIIIYLNGHAVGRYEGTGPQNDFYLPEPWITPDSKIDLLVDGADDVDVEVKFPYLVARLHFEIL